MGVIAEEMAAGLPGEEKIPLLSAIMVMGSCRGRAQRVIDALAGQTAAAAIEIIVVDVAGDRFPAPRLPGKTPFVHLVMPPSTLFSAARLAGLARARSNIVAFIEDHCYPEPDWAEQLIEAHRGPWAAVGYAFTNANPNSWLSRSGLLADYGDWVYPVPGGRVASLPGSNISYKKDALLPLGKGLEQGLAVDYLLHVLLFREGRSLFLAPRARAAHENFTRAGAMLAANHVYGRAMAAHRAQLFGWGLPRRLFYSLAAPLFVPPLRLWRFLRNLAGRQALWPRAAAALPFVALTYIGSALGESIGYLSDPVRAERSLLRWEVETERETPG